ncbi:hypothetical protein F9K88_08455 [Brucella intermedia]|nr:hypothetical protein F9K88_08455 [Brucella intermedia]MBQ0709156.1 hypothetical protein [Ochrobactrum sp. AP1BH01-1]PJT19803.1 hypothetical protein CN884_18730 [Ochrobactrum sp. 30A/1000/2015]PJT40809.1 hypothetical protein CN883_04990 [Ochrobactrum sp. 27A/999/2015]PJT45181.1 hypothetical protein CN882_05055 [Ochrobactrum sp. 23A/997/2015]
MEGLMHLTGYGENFIRSDRSTRLFRGNQLLAAGSEDDYITIDLFEAGCYDAAVYLRFLFGAGISLNTLRGTSSQNWIPILNFRAGEQWNGYSALPFGKAIGFYDVQAGHIFHAAISLGDVYIRGVHGGKLGQNWQDRTNLTRVLPYSSRNADGSFNYDRRKIYVYISKL